MKSEERHKLQQNELADIIGVWIEAVKPYKNAIYAGVLVVLIAILLYVWRRHESTGSLMAANNDFAQAMASGNPDALLQTFDDYPQSPIAPAAAIAAGDIRLRLGTDQLLQKPAIANQNLQHALDLYRKALEKNPDGILREQAYFGLGRAEESLGKLKEAAEYYGKVIDENPAGAYADLARQRRDDLRRQSTKEFYDRLASFEPKTAVQDPLNEPKPGGGLDTKDLPQEEPIYPLKDPLKLGLSSDEEKPAASGEEKKPDKAQTPALPDEKNPALPATGEEKKPEAGKSPAPSVPETPAPPTGGEKKPEEAKTAPPPVTPPSPTPPDSAKKPGETTPPAK